MKLTQKTIIYSLLFMSVSANVAHAHGFTNDGHITAMDYIQVVGIGLISLGLLAYSFDKWRKDRKNRQK